MSKDREEMLARERMCRLDCISMERSVRAAEEAEGRSWRDGSVRVERLYETPFR